MLNARRNISGKSPDEMHPTSLDFAIYWVRADKVQWPVYLPLN